MAVSYVPKNYLTNKLDIKHFNFDFLWLFRGLNNTKRLKLSIGLIQMIEILKTVSKMAASLKQNSTGCQIRN